jgi:hypothetical protein
MNIGPLYIVASYLASIFLLYILPAPKDHALRRLSVYGIVKKSLRKGGISVIFHITLSESAHLDVPAGVMLLDAPSFRHSGPPGQRAAVSPWGRTVTYTACILL